MKTSPSRAVAARDAYLELMRVHEALRKGSDALFKAHGLTQAQFNVLRILRGAPEEGLPTAEVGARLVNRLPDVTRLVDRMEASGLVQRRRSTEDRRVVIVTLTAGGKALVDSLDDPVLELHLGQFAGLSGAKLEALLALLQELRASLPA